MIGPSSSHTAGVVRIAGGTQASGKLRFVPRSPFYNSFARTYEGHGSDRAIIAGLPDMHTDDERIREALDVAQKAGFSCGYSKLLHHAAHHHPNTIRIELVKGKKAM
ncbi:MAG: serine dehydratase beta chain [Bacteroidia bacterium]